MWAILLGLVGLAFDLIGFVIVWTHVQALNSRVVEAPRLAMEELKTSFDRLMAQVGQRAPRPPIGTPIDAESAYLLQERHRERRLDYVNLTAQTVAAVLKQAINELASSEKQAKTDARKSLCREWSGAIFVLFGTLLQAAALFVNV
ncbi:hypothetical protein [Mesorhizobium australicum]|uniref:Uncharacterized protein n=1 Tax=Mesorhizobium australicum TaxID=536018 RepID=A0A1X7NEG7_9HYPH|nr:hypothetical protein [Mesorhizobium australicum]SMH36057.1 hypothetical protein SAMN02982922_1681 [Mesorhizobium australicum]